MPEQNPVPSTAADAADLHEAFNDVACWAHSVRAMAKAVEVSRRMNPNHTVTLQRNDEGPWLTFEDVTAHLNQAMTALADLLTHSQAEVEAADPYWFAWFHGELKQRLDESGIGTSEGSVYRAVLLTLPATKN